MIDLYFDHTPNGQKVHIMLEETGMQLSIGGFSRISGSPFEISHQKSHEMPKTAKLFSCCRRSFA